MILGDSLSAIGLIYILVCMLKGGAAIWQICIGVTISSVFSTLMDPAYKATVTDLLTEEEYSKASGLVQVAGSSKYLFSPIIAGFLLTVSDIKFLLILDICTFFVTVLVTTFVRKGLASKKTQSTCSFISQFKDGWQAITENKGIFILVILSSLLTFFMAFIQTLSTPMILSFSKASVLGVCETICGVGMLIASLIIGIITIKKGYVKILTISLFLNGIFMALFGLRENIILITIAGFLFFATLPFANTCLDLLIRTNVKNELQGRVWGLIGLISQLGYVIAYAVVGPLADYVFTPMLVEGGVLADSVGKAIGVGTGRGTGLLIIIAGLLLSITALVLYGVKSVRRLDKNYA